LDVILWICCGKEDHVAGQPGLFDLNWRYSVLSAAGDPLERLGAVIDFELFRGELDAALDHSDRARAAGRGTMRC
jgi:hypothetical protein